MYVCVCKAVTDREVTRAIHQGACTRRQLVQCTGVGSVCGKCSQSLKALLDDTLRQQNTVKAA